MSPKLRNICRRIARTKGSGDRHKRARLWQAIRILRDFTTGDLMAVAEQDNRKAVLTWLAQLRRAGYLHVQRDMGHRNENRYRLIRNTGPVCPSLVHRGRALYDHNTDQEYPVRDEH